LVDDLVNTLLFLLMGFQILDLDLGSFEVAPVIAAIPLALVSRFVSVVVPVAVLPLGVRDKGKAIAALTWLGLRGAVSIALVLTIPPGPYQAVLSAACYGVVIFTIVVQGLLTPHVITALYKNASATPAIGHSSEAGG
jgi:CPA1 family monovalent cation:H+ antiporter